MQLQNETRIKELLGELDKLVPKEGSYIDIYQYGGGPDESGIRGNKVGYLRLGIAIAKGAFAGPMAEDPTLIDIDLENELGPETDFHFDYFIRDEKLIEQKRTAAPPETVRDRVVKYFILGLILLIPIFAIIGVIATVNAMSKGFHLNIRF